MQELVVESLVVSLAMVVFYVLVDETTQMPLAERDHACETLLFDRPDEPLGIGVEIGTLRRQPNRLNTGALQDLAKDPRIEGIAVVNQMARPAQTAIDRVGQIAGLLLHPRAARLRVDPGDGHAAGSQLDHEEDEVPPEPRQRQHLDGEQIAGRRALPVRLQERLPGHVPAPLGRRVDSVVVQDPLHRGPGDSVAEVRERAADPRVAPPRIVDRHPDHELGDVLSGHWSTSTSAGAAIVCLGDQSPVPTQDRIRGDDARDLRQDPPAEFVTAHSESTTLGVRQAKRPRAQVFSEDPILLPEIVDQIVLVTVHPASEREDEELQRRRHSLRLLGRLDQHRPSLGRFFAPYGIDPAPERSRRLPWKTFLQAHWEGLTACDRFTVEVLTLAGIQRYLVFFVIALQSRRVTIAGIPPQPYGTWMEQMARNLTDPVDGCLRRARYLMHDRDPLDTRVFGEILKGGGVQPIRLPPKSPNLNAYAERFVRSMK